MSLVYRRESNLAISSSPVTNNNVQSVVLVWAENSGLFQDESILLV